jgi:hypothetical protein
MVVVPNQQTAACEHCGTAYRVIVHEGRIKLQLLKTAPSQSSIKRLAHTPPAEAKSSDVKAQSTKPKKANKKARQLRIGCLALIVLLIIIAAYVLPDSENLGDSPEGRALQASRQFLSDDMEVDGLEKIGSVTWCRLRESEVEFDDATGHWSVTSCMTYWSSSDPRRTYGYWYELMQTDNGQWVMIDRKRWLE